MSELFTMWKNTRMIVLTAICAAAYVAVLLPFKGFVLIPGLTEVRPGAAIPVTMSFLFGPAAAWGAGFGNLIADAFGGTIGPGSIPGFLGNFFYGFAPYALWRAFFGHKSPLKAGAKGWIIYGLILVVSCMIIGSIIGWGVDLLRLAPFGALGLIITVNNLIASTAIATVLLALLYKRVQNWGLLYFQILDDDSESFDEDGEVTRKEFTPGKLVRIGAILCIVGSFVAFFTGLFISAEVLSVGYGAAGFASDAKGTFAVSGGMAPGLLIMLLGLILL